MAERPTTTFTTPGGLRVVLNAYLTGRESDDVKSAILSSFKLNVGQEGSTQAVSGEVVMEQQKRAMQYLLVSVNDNSENPLEVLLDGPASEYEAVVQKVNEITNPSTQPKPSTLGGATTTSAQ